MTPGRIRAASTAPTSVLDVVAQVTGINLKTVGTTNLMTVAVNRTFVVTGAVVRITVADTITVVGTAGLGVAAGEDDVFPAVALTGLDAVGEAYFFAQGGTTRKVVAAGEILKLGIDVGYTATTATGAVEVLGYYL